MLPTRTEQVDVPVPSIDISNNGNVLGVLGVDGSIDPTVFVEKINKKPTL